MLLALQLQDEMCEFCTVVKRYKKIHVLFEVIINLPRPSEIGVDPSRSYDHNFFFKFKMICSIIYIYVWFNKDLSIVESTEWRRGQRSS